MSKTPRPMLPREPVARLESTGAVARVWIHGVMAKFLSAPTPGLVAAAQRLVDSINLAATGRAFYEHGVRVPPIAVDADDAYVWAIFFDDTERTPEFLFTESAARQRYEQISRNWNAHLFVKVASNTRDDRHASKNFTVPKTGAAVDVSALPARAPIVHTLKTDPQTFDDVVAKLKTFEIRKRDRDYRVGDILHLLRTESTGAEMAAGAPLAYSGQGCLVRVLHMLEGYGLDPDWVILSIEHWTPAEDRLESADTLQDAAAATSATLAPRLVCWQCRPPKGGAWGPATTRAIARELHAEGYKVRALEVSAAGPFGDFKKD